MCAPIGSDTAVTRFETRVTVNDTDRVAGFAALEAGFRFANSGVSATWDSFFEVSGDIGLSHGTLTLDRDFILRDTAAVKELGDIIGQDHTIEFSSSISCIPYSDSGDDAFQIERTDRETQSEDVESCDFSFDGKFVAMGLGGSTSNYLQTYEDVSGDLQFRDSELASSSEITCVRWHPSSYLLAVARLNISGDDFMIYEVNSSTGVLTYKDGLGVYGSVYALDWHPTGNWLAVGQHEDNEVSIYAVDGSGNITSSPVASINISDSDAIQTQALQWDQSGNYLLVGFDNSPELRAYEFNQVTPALTAKGTESIGKPVRSLAWNKQYPTILAVGLEGTSGELLQIYEYDSSGGGSFTKRDARDDLNAFVRSVAFNPDGDILGVGRNATAGDELRFYGYNPTTKLLTDIVFSFNYTNQVEAVRWNADGTSICVGSDANLLDLYSFRRSEDDCVTFYDVNIFLNQDLYLKQKCLHFSGESMLSGRGNTLTLDPECTIFIDPESSLLIRDIEIQGINGNKIQCTDSSSTMSLHDVEWVQDGDFSFTTGKFVVLNDFVITGDEFIFAYETDQVSTVSTEGRIIVDNGMTFSYAPSISSKVLLDLYTDTSELVLNGGTLYATDVGMDLDTGRLIFDRNASVVSEGAVEDDGILLKSSLDLQWLPAAQSNFEGFVAIEST